MKKQDCFYLGKITKKYSFLDPDQETRVRRSPIKVLDNLVTLAEEEQVDFILLAGDTFDDDMPSSDNYFKKFQYFLRKLDQLNIDIYIVLGNHDVASDLLKSFESKKLPGNTYVFPAKNADTFIIDTPPKIPNLSKSINSLPIEKLESTFDIKYKHKPIFSNKAKKAFIVKDSNNIVIDSDSDDESDKVMRKTLSYAEFIKKKTAIELVKTSRST